jgi:hypothetical protein
MSDFVLKNFENAGDFVDHVKNNPCHISWREDHSKSEGDFYGCSWPDALKYATEGWPEGLKALSGELSVIRTQGNGRARVYDVAGDYPIIGRAVAGMPDSMSRRVINNASKRPIIDLYISPQMTCRGDNKKFMKLGAAIVDLVDTLENSGYSVNITVSMATKSKRVAGHVIAAAINLKSAGQSLDLEKMAFFLAHPSFLRRLGFKFFTVETSEDKLGDGLGTYLDQADHDKIAQPGSIQIITSAGVVNSIKSTKDALQWVKDQVKSQRPDLIEDVTNMAA